MPVSTDTCFSPPVNGRIVVGIRTVTDMAATLSGANSLPDRSGFVRTLASADVRIRKVVAAPDKFKGTITAAEVARAIGQACWDLGVDCAEVPMADGGDGILEALGGPNRTSVVTGPARRSVAGTVAAVEGHRRDRDGPRQRAGDRRWRRAQRPARRVDDRHGRADRPRPRRRRPADHRRPRRLGDDRRRLRRHAGDHGDRPPQAGGAARRLRRHHDRSRRPPRCSARRRAPRPRR